MREILTTPPPPHRNEQSIADNYSYGVNMIVEISRL